MTSWERLASFFSESVFTSELLLWIPLYNRSASWSYQEGENQAKGAL